MTTNVEQQEHVTTCSAPMCKEAWCHRCLMCREIKHFCCAHAKDHYLTEHPYSDAAKDWRDR